jgi:flagellar protein FlaI
MNPVSFEAAWRDAHPVAPPPRSIVALIRAGTLDAELAAHLWLLLEARVSLLVAGGPRLAGKSTLLTALLDFLPPNAVRIVARGAPEDFAWLDEADPQRTVILASELSGHLPAYTWGPDARRLIRAAGSGFGLLSTIHAESLEGVFAQLRMRPVGATDDELSAIGVVVVLGALPPVSGDRRDEPRRRVVAAHYVRPIARDAHGHIQRLGPAVLATHDATRDAFEHFGWGIMPELAFRVGRRAGDYEHEHERRTMFLGDLVDAGIESPEEVRRAIAGYAVAPALSTT